ncbi:MAG: PaaI family thioesterase [Pseudomonadota bacterium]
MTGLELMKMMIAGKVPPPTMASHFDMKLVDVREGYALFEAKADDTHLNPLQSVHGGFASTILDSACGTATATTLPAGKGFTSIDLSIKFLRPVPQGEVLACEGIVQRPGRTVAFTEATLKTKEGRLLAHATSALAIIDLPS